jgi:hypothetical protein
MVASRNEISLLMLKNIFQHLEEKFCISAQPCNILNYVASSVNGQDVPNPALWLAARASKMALSCPLGITRCVPQENSVLFPYNKSFIDQACSVKMAGYWPCSFFVCLWTSTPSWSINTQKKNLANVQPSCPTHKLMYCIIKYTYCIAIHCTC